MSHPRDDCEGVCSRNSTENFYALMLIQVYYCRCSIMLVGGCSFGELSPPGNIEILPQKAKMCTPYHGTSLSYSVPCSHVPRPIQ